MSDYDRILRARSDITSWLLHMTGSLEELKSILKDGFLRPTFARRTFQSGERKPTIFGPYPAVCLSEMPLWAAAELCRAGLAKKRYRPFGISLQKKILHKVGGRTVLYGDEKLRGRELVATDDNYKSGRRLATGGLDEELLYLWVNHDPNRSGYPIDWTHEREWRIRSDDSWYFDDEEYPFEGVPLELSRWSKKRKPPTFRVFVETSDDKRELLKFIKSLQSIKKPANDYLEDYYARLHGLVIVVMNDVSGADAKMEDYD